MARMKQYLITGCIVVVPAVLTVYVLYAIFLFADGILGRFLNIYFQETLGFYIPGIGFVLSFLIILSAGFLAKRFVGRKIFMPLERWFSGLPIIDNIYPVFKQIVQFIGAQKELGFKKVALIEYPSKGIWSLGFVTNEQFKEVDSTCGKQMLAILVPTVPNPLTGFVIFVPKEEVRFPDISVTDAMKIIISGGVLKYAGATA
ncbi:MAG TPA: DUF502 domain-containing protein [Patescibacteria group bacterium]|nr:DUF502 domain-containing protein [Patescibacteria group bacterium]